MNDLNSSRVSLKKDESQSQGYVDPSTGEIYPNRPNSIPASGVSSPYISASVPHQAQPAVQPDTAPAQQNSVGYRPGMKFCSYCGAQVLESAVICPSCGSQIKALEGAQQPAQQVVVNNVNNVNQTSGVYGRPKSKVVALLLCFFLGLIGAHRFYEGKIGTGLLWLFTGGFFGIGAFIDFIILLTKPSTYYV